jgi:hypothetical protein
MANDELGWVMGVAGPANIAVSKGCSMTRNISYAGWDHTISTRSTGCDCCFKDDILVATLAIKLSRLERELRDVRNELRFAVYGDPGCNHATVPKVRKET